MSCVRSLSKLAVPSCAKTGWAREARCSLSSEARTSPNQRRYLRNQCFDHGSRLEEPSGVRDRRFGEHRSAYSSTEIENTLMAVAPILTSVDSSSEDSRRSALRELAVSGAPSRWSPSAIHRSSLGGSPFGR